MSVFCPARTCALARAFRSRVGRAHQGHSPPTPSPAPPPPIPSPPPHLTPSPHPHPPACIGRPPTRRALHRPPGRASTLAATHMHARRPPGPPPPCALLLLSPVSRHGFRALAAQVSRRTSGRLCSPRAPLVSPPPTDRPCGGAAPRRLLELFFGHRCLVFFFGFALGPLHEEGRRAAPLGAVLGFFSFQQQNTGFGRAALRLLFFCYTHTLSHKGSPKLVILLLGKQASFIKHRPPSNAGLKFRVWTIHPVVGFSFFCRRAETLLPRYRFSHGHPWPALPKLVSAGYDFS
ncbi:protein De10 [Common bottlenose dolphin gammaherpesvirus 1 strain Sarasota]|uniref:Protein De10 n=1 Tax=Common bottlenose dolphin gammaherpesvirus 1 strain Sarasota TaxID=2022783 RepID=A0A1Z1NEA9_9GAMA|nr:protein De10 [Common bottlenose dolphin gammaherpesvirus 1 strain Sarasota]ARW78138.1 protein De10 [Common bottlenose dolphin gammaherpesvirus 1 strain Sarasota]